MADPLYADVAVDLDTFKDNPSQMVMSGNGETIAVTIDGQPAFYCVPAAIFEKVMDQLEDHELNAIADTRQGSPATRMTVEEL